VSHCPREAVWHSQSARILDPFTALGAAAAVTSRLKLGTGICVVAQHDPIILAKQVATIDHLSGGRFLFGAGAGWLVEEIHNHGVEPRLRWALMREKLMAMKRIWADEEAEFHGQFVDFDPIYLWPKPVQNPRPPVLIAGTGPRSLRIVAELGDAWMPVVVDVTEFEQQLSQLRRICEQAGRNPQIEVTAVVVPPDDADLGAWEPDQQLLERCAELGVIRCATWAPMRDLAVLRAFLERYLQISDLSR